MVLSSMLAMTACNGAAVGGSGDAGGSGGGTISLGLITPVTGTLAQAGEDQRNGAEIAVEMINDKGGLIGKKLALDVQDDGSSAQKTSQAAQNLMSADHKLVLGAVASTECSAAASVIPKQGGVFLPATCVAPDLTGSNGSAGTDGVFRTGLRSAPDEKAEAMMPKTLKELIPGITSWDYFGYDYSFGHQQQSTFQQNLGTYTPGVTMGSAVFAPLNSEDFRPYVTQLAGKVQPGSSQGLFLGTYGAGSTSFFQQADSFNFLQNYKGIFTTGDPWDVLLALKGKFPKIWTSYDYVWSAFNNPTNQEFVKRFKAKYNRMPGGWSADSFNAVMAYAAAIKSAGSAEPADVKKAMPGLQYDSLQGQQTIDATTHQANTKRVLAQVEGDSSSPDGVKILQVVIVEPDATYSVQTDLLPAP